MAENSPIQRPSTPPATNATSGSEKAAEAAKGGPAFRALLESLQEKARSLQHDSQHVDRPEELSQAVDRARASLSDALSLSDRLLEAYREAVQQDESDTTDRSASDDSA